MQWSAISASLSSVQGYLYYGIIPIFCGDLHILYSIVGIKQIATAFPWLIPYLMLNAPASEWQTPKDALAVATPTSADV